MCLYLCVSDGHPKCLHFLGHSVYISLFSILFVLYDFPHNHEFCVLIKQSQFGIHVQISESHHSHAKRILHIAFLVIFILLHCNTQ
jgi:hypothetical protein